MENIFDRVFERRNTGSLKYDSRPRGTASDRLIPMWVADMDFQSPPAVLSALEEVAKRGIFGYPDADEALDLAVCDWYTGRLGWAIRPEWLVRVPGVMFGISAAIRALTGPEDGILICQPVYYPFANTIEMNGRRLVVLKLRLAGGRYEYDFEDIARKIQEQRVRMLLLCSPHNPVGRVWTREELTALGEICNRHGVYLVSDEIHCDFVYPGHPHISVAGISDAFADFTVTCFAPTKTFNLAGLQSAVMVVPNPRLRGQIQAACAAVGLVYNMMAAVAAKAAYRQGTAWLDALLKYLWGNVQTVREAFSAEQGISLIVPEGTYLLWLDCRGMGLDDDALRDFFIKKAEVWLHSGRAFGQGGSGFMRMNIACPRPTLTAALDRIGEALRQT